MDVALFQFLNQAIANPVLDKVMPFFSGNRFFIPAVILAAVLLLWRGGSRGRVFIPVLFAILALGDAFVINTIKHAVARPRPYTAVAHTRELVGRGESGSMPSSHTSTWFAATLLAYVFYRRSWRFMLPLAGLVALSRMYVGVHYPSDVLAGAILGAGYGAAGIFAINALWRSWGRAWFPEQWERWPSLLEKPKQPFVAPRPAASTATAEIRWMMLGYVLIAVTLIARLLYLAAGKIELSEDEAYQWLWSKHLALSYYSKPPLIALAQFCGTSIWGDTEFGVRFLSPVIAAIISLVLLRFISKQVNARTAFWLVVMLQCAPLLAVGATLLTIDPLLVLFWTLATVAGWRAIQPQSTASDWGWAGISIGAGFLSKYSAAYQIICFLLFLIFWKPAREHLRRPGPYLALGLVLVCALPVIVWNSQHNWVTLTHVAANASLDKTWKLTLRFLGEFAGSELFLLNPIFIVGAIWASIAFWKQTPRNPLMVYLFCMSVPVLLGHLLYSVNARILPNWIAPAVTPLFALAAIFWEQRWSAGARQVKSWLLAGILLGAIPIVFLHDTNLITKVAGNPLPARIDPLRRVRGWRVTAAEVGEERQRLHAEGKEVFIIGAHYGLVGEISFYLPEAREAVSRTPVVYYKSADHPENQFYFWPGYLTRAGQNAIYVHEESPGATIPQRVQNEFESVADLGLRFIHYRGRLLRTLHLYACRNLLPNAKGRD